MSELRIFGQIEDFNKAWFYVMRKRQPPKVGDKITVGLTPRPTQFSRRDCEVVGIEQLPEGRLYRLRRIEEEQGVGE